MKLIKVAGASLNQTPLAWKNNKAHIIEAIETSKKLGVSILCLPELCLSGRGCEDEFLSPNLHKMTLKVLKEILPFTKGIAVSIGLPLLHQSNVFNTTCFIIDGIIQAFVAKHFLNSRELRWFKPWPEAHTNKIDGYSIFSETKIFDALGIKVAIKMREDIQNTKNFKEANIVLNPIASHFSFSKHEKRRKSILTHSQKTKTIYISTNLLGCDAGMIYDGSVLITSRNQILEEGKRFSYKDVLITSTVINTKQTATKHSITETKNEEFCSAVSLGLFDYMRKTNSFGYIVSLSGGIDSATVVCLVYFMACLGVAELTIDGFRERLSYIKGIENANDIKSLTKKILTCVCQATENNTHATQEAAEELAEEIGAQYYNFDINSIVESYTKLISDKTGCNFNWKDDDVALQNVQARARVPGIWLLANKENKLLLNTGNKSEALVGYATMDGDTCGVLSPIGDVSKTFLRSWIKWASTSTTFGIPAVSRLNLITKQSPSAELRPQNKAQTDEKDLMPYEVLDKIGQMVINNKTPLQIFNSLRSQDALHYSEKQLETWIEKFFKLWCKNQWKKKRYALSFHLDDESFNSKKFPSISGNYASELEKLNSYCKKFL
jgi:NAD+ synthase (glutamine-hydrolysing)